MINDKSVAEKFKQMSALHGLTQRDGQVNFVNIASNVFRNGGVGCIEAGTGTGKSFAYGLTGCVIAKESEKKLIISTGNVSLQQQLIASDMPRIQQVVSGLKVSVAKGKSRFICWARVEKRLNNAFVGEIQNLKRDGWTGDYDNLPEHINVNEVKSVCVDNHCKGRGCAYFSSCEYQLNKELTKNADVIITNHSYLLTDLALGGGVVLPKLEDCLLAIDECHTLPDVAIKAFSDKHLVDGVCHDLIGAINFVGQIEGFAGEMKGIQESSNNVLSQLTSVFNSLEQSQNLNKYGQIVFKDGEIPENLKAICSSISSEGKKLKDRIEFFKQSVDDEVNEGHSAAIKATNVYEKCLESVKKMLKVWNLYDEKIEHGEAPIAKWIKKETSTKVDYEIGASITSAEKKLKDSLIDKCGAIIFTSATMSVNGSFEVYKKDCGLSGVKCEEYVCKSPFNYKDSSNIVVPSMKSDPSSNEEHTEELIQMLPKVIKVNEGSLILFSSKEQMLKVAKAVAPILDGEILIQGDFSKKIIIEKHKTNVDAGLTSVIFGLDSFYEGIDLKGKYCSTVGISKIPFPALNDPVYITRKSFIEKNGGNAFSEIVMPYVIKKMVQGVGRLIRTMNDYGDVFIFDTRMATKGYGREIMKCMPEMKRQILVNI